jgi:hypothetical protein
MFGNQFKFSSLMRHPGYNDPITALAAATIGSAVIGGVSASNAADAQADAAAAGQKQQQRMFDQQNKQLAPQRAAGYNALNQIGAMLPGESQKYDAQGNPIGTQTGSGYFTNQFSNEDLNAQLSPNYAFQLGQGQQANRYANNATGGLVGGNAMRSLQDYTQDYAGNAYQKAFENYQGQRTNIYNTLAGIAGLGQTANQTSAGLSANTANAISSLGVGAANAQAAGTIGTANAITGGIQGLGNMNYLNNIMNSGANTAGSVISNPSMGYGSSSNPGTTGVNAFTYRAA